MRRFFEEHKLDNSNGFSKKRVKKIRHSVLARVEEDKSVKKRRFIKPLIIAAAIAVTAAASTLAVGASSNGEPSYAVRINGENVPFTVEVIDGEAITYTFEATGETIDAYETGVVIKYELPEEIVIGDSREVTYTSKEICAADDGRVVSGYDHTEDGHIEKLPGLPFRTSVKHNGFFNTLTIDVEYDLSAAYSTKTAE
ncbi:MAG: hypothetical protein K2N38_13040 [Oscillospiraceae bacterium]|nr:hypothetical protein [Oscillospiraceae bacterium]